MIKSLLFLGALAPSMLSGNVPSRSLDTQPTLQVGDVYRLDVLCDVGDYSSNTFVNLIDNQDFNCFKFDTDTFVVNFVTYSSQITLSFDDLNHDFCYFDFVTRLGFSSLYQSFIYAEDFNDGLTLSYALITHNRVFSFTYSIEFVITEIGFNFNSEALPYLTKVETPYTPPTKSNLYRLLYDFYYSVFGDDDLHSINTNVNIPFDNWICHTLTIITLVGLVFILFLLLRWLFKVISGLILLKQ